MNNIDNIITDNINNFLIKEGLENNNSPLYHNTSMENLLRIMSTNSMSSNFHRGYKEGEAHNGICFTRDFKYSPYTCYDVRLTFDVNKIRNYGRGLKLIPYQDASWASLDEYEERLVSKNGKDFSISPISDIVTEVLIILDRACTEIIENGLDERDYIKDLRNIAHNNIFGKKLHIVKDINSKESLSLRAAVQYIKVECAE